MTRSHTAWFNFGMTRTAAQQAIDNVMRDVIAADRARRQAGTPAPAAVNPSTHRAMQAYYEGN